MRTLSLLLALSLLFTGAPVWASPPESAPNPPGVGKPLFAPVQQDQLSYLSHLLAEASTANDATRDAIGETTGAGESHSPGSPGSPGTSEADADLRDRIYALEDQRREIQFGPPAAAVMAGGALSILSAIVLTTTGLICAETYSDCNDTSNDNVANAVGGTVLGIGLTAVTVGLVQLQKRKGQRKEIDRQILDLRRRAQHDRARSYGLGLVVGGQPGLSVSIAY